MKEEKNMALLSGMPKSPRSPTTCLIGKGCQSRRCCIASHRVVHAVAYVETDDNCFIRVIVFYFGLCSECPVVDFPCSFSFLRVMIGWTTNLKKEERRSSVRQVCVRDDKPQFSVK
jgi:hypothetical protein